MRLPDELELWPARAAIEAAVETEAAEHPLLALMSRTKIERDGRVQPEPEGAADREAARLVRAFSWRTQLGLGPLRLIIDELRRRDVWDADVVVRAISLADQKLGQAAAAGVHLYEDGEYWAAVHVLVPQIERGVRALGRAAGADVASLARDSGYRWAPLEQLLIEPAISTALGPDFTGVLQAVLIDPHGLNLRNNLAHGGLEPEADVESLACLALTALITVANRLVQHAERAAEVDPRTDP